MVATGRGAPQSGVLLDPAKRHGATMATVATLPANAGGPGGSPRWVVHFPSEGTSLVFIDQAAVPVLA